MQVKKFEAKTMKEALTMVKTELGPDAIILSAKDHKKGYGIAGSTSVELTAAISEQKYKERQYALSRLKEEEKQKIMQAKAKSQKKFIEKAVSRFHEDYQLKQKRMLPQRKQYIEIADEMQQETSQNNNSSTSKVRVQSAVQSALQSLNQDFADSLSVNPQRMQKKQKPIDPLYLQQEIQRLNQVIQGFQKMPQNFIKNYAGVEFDLAEEFSSIFEKLSYSGINKDLLAEILHKANDQMKPEHKKKKALIEAWVAKYILDEIEVTGDNIGKNIEIFLGGSGSGKTASLIKYASYQIIIHRRSLAILTTDTMKVGAIEQLRIYAKILNVPFAVIRSSDDWEPILSQLNQVDHILVDTPGVTLKDIKEIDLLKSKIQPVQKKARIHYVAPITASEYPAIEMAKRFQMFHYHDIICTKLDESSNHGLIYTLNKKLSLPLHSFGIGGQVPEDYEFATRERVLDLLFKITKAKG